MPTLLYDPQLVEAILSRLAAGESLRSICRDQGMPSDRTVRGWATEDRDGFGARYDLAREMQAHSLLDEIMDEGRTATDAGLGRLKFDALRWAASKILPKVYGDRVGVDHTGVPTLLELLNDSYRTIEHDVVNSAQITDESDGYKDKDQET